MKKYLLIIVPFIIIIAAASYFFYFKDKIRINKEVELSQTLNMINDSFSTGDLDKAIEFSKKLLEKDPNNIDYQIKLADSYVSKGSIDHEESTYAPMAIEIINSVISKEPNNSEAYRVLGYANEILQKFDEAIKNYNKSIELDNKNALAYNARGHAYDLMGDFEKAEADYLKAYDLDPNEPIILINIARINLIKGELDKAKEFSLKVIDSDAIYYVKATAYSTLAQIYIFEENPDKALESINVAIELLPKFVFSYTTRANIIINKYYSDETKTISEEESRTVKSDLDKVISINQNNVFAYSAYARFFEIKKEYDKAIEYHQKAISVVEQDLAIPLSIRPVVVETHTEEIKRINNLKQ
jgi:tetratricopeptide (TPR) repeat protein